MIYSKANLMVKDVAHKDASEEVLNRVQLEEDGSTVASNGSIMMAVSPVNREGVSFPEVDSEEVDPDGGVGVRLEIVEDVVKNLPRGGTTSLQHAMLVRADEKRVELMTVDRTKEKKVAARPARGAYPEWKGVMRRARKAVGPENGGGRVCLNRRDLIQLLEAMDKACPDKGNESPVFIEFGAEEDGLLLRTANYQTGQRAIGYILPLDTDGAWLPVDGWEKRVLRKSAKRRKGGIS